MPEVAFSKPVQAGDVTKVNDEVAVGEDLQFQQKWWRFERFIWSFFAFIVLLDLAGAFGRGPLAHHEIHATDGSADVKYDRIARAETPAILDVKFSPFVLQQGRIKLFVSQSIVEQLGAQRVIPAPETTAIGGGGLTYTFPATSNPATSTPASVQFALQPSKPGVFRFVIQVVGAQPVNGTVVVLP